MIGQLKEKRNKLISDANAILEAAKGNMNAEQTAQFDAMYADADALKGNIERAERAAAMDAEMRSTVTPPPVALGGAVDSTEAKKAAHKAAFRDYLVNGRAEMSAANRQVLAQYRDLSDTTGSAGAFLIPTDLQREIEVAMKFFGGMRQAARVIKTASGNPINWPKNDDTGNPGKRLNATSTPGTVDELDVAFTQSALGAWTYTTQKISVPNELLQDSVFDLDAFIKDAFVTRIGRIQNTEFTVGTGTTMPNGVAVATTTGIIGATGETLQVSYNSLVDLVHKLDIAYRPGAQFMFHDTFLASLRKLTNTYGQPLLGLGINGGDPDSVLGYKYVVNNDIVAPGVSHKSALFGQFSKYIIRDSGDLQIRRLEEIGALQNETVFVGFSRADGQLVDAGQHPVVSYTNSAS